MPTTAVPPAMERPHFIGIGGAGMSGIARILAARGAHVAGTDARESATVNALRQAGATVHVGHDSAHLAADASCVVVSSAIRADNPELRAARERGLPVVHRSDALASLMEGRRALAVAGTHGKTTTTSMLAVSLRSLGLDPSYAIGGDLDGPGTNAAHGEGELFVAEADESDRSFHKYAPEVAIILNVELDHHANYASMEQIHESFETFVGRVRPGGTLVVSADHDGARELTARVRGRADLRVVTYGEREDADVRVLRVTPYRLTSRVTVELDGQELDFTISVPGRHYAHNAVAALAAGAAAGVPAAALADALRTYTGVNRRLQLRGEARGVQVIDTYAHHPTEMTADLEAMRSALPEGGRVLVLFQPHLYSRTQQLSTEMGHALTLADAAAVLDIYPAREDPVPGVTSDLIVEAGLAAGADLQHVSPREAAPELLAGMAKPGDVVLTMGAGDVTELGPLILARLTD